MPWTPGDAVQPRCRVGPVQATSTGLHLRALVQPFCRCLSGGVNLGHPKVSHEPGAARGENSVYAGGSDASSPREVAVVGMDEAGPELLSLCVWLSVVPSGQCSP